MPSSIIIGQGGGSGGGSGSNASVGLTGATAPTSATEIGIIVAGNLEGVSAANPLPVSGAGGGTQYTDETAETAGAFTITVVGLYNGTDVVGLRGDASNNLLINVNTALPAGSNLIGQVEVSDGTNIIGTSAHPIRIDPTGTTVQPISATSLPLPANAAQETGGNLAAIKTDTDTLAGTVSSSKVRTTDAADGTPGAALPANAILVGGSDGTNLRAIATDATGQQKTLPGMTSGTFTWTSATSLNAVSNVLSNNPFYSTITFTVVPGASLSGGDWTLQGSQDGSSWDNIGLYSVRQNEFLGGSLGPLSFFAGGQVTNYTANVTGFAYLQFKLTTQISGAGNTIITWVVAGEAGQAIPVTYPKIISSATTAQTEPITTMQPNNDLVGTNGALAVTICAQTGAPGNNSGAMLRTPSKFFTASVPATASGNTAVWTPTSGKKFRLMRFQITGSNIAATAATVLTVSFQDATTGITIGTYDVLMPATANVVSGVMNVSSGWVDLGNGFLSAAANNVLNANVSATVIGATGAFRVNVCGTEE